MAYNTNNNNNCQANGLPTETLNAENTRMFVTEQGRITVQPTFYGIQQQHSVYGLGTQTFQGHPQYGQIMHPIQIPGSIFDPQQNFNQYSNARYQAPTYDVQTFQSHMSPHQDVQETTIFVPPLQDAQEKNSSFRSNNDTVHQTQQCSTFDPQQNFNQYSNGRYQSPTYDVQTFQSHMSPHQDNQETTIFIPPLQDAQETSSSIRSNNDTVHQTQQCDHNPIIVENINQDPAPEVVQEVLEETEEKAVSTPDAATTSDYAENLWELICEFCPAESSVSSLLACHICDMSLVESENKENIICNTCFSRLPSGMTLKRHKETRRHLLLLLNYKGDTKIDKLQFCYCSTCRVQCNNFAAYTKHLLSQKHIEFEECLSFNLYYCSKCKLMMDGIAYEIHVSSKTHLLNCMISNTRLFCLTSKLDVSNLNCTICKEKFVNGKLYNTHLYSVKHCSNLIKLKLKNDFSHSKQYVFFNNNKYVCVLCKINIRDKTSLVYHFLTDEHKSHEVSFRKIQYEKFVSGDCHLTSHLKEQYLNCSECKHFKRDCEHMFKNVNAYKAWKEKIEKGKYCMYCNCFSDQSHELTELHKKMKGAVNYCRVCDKVLTIDIVKHEQGSRHRTTLSMFGTGGVEPKRGPSKMFCGVCDVTSDTEENHLQHLAGLNHRTQYNTKCIENRFNCKLCNFTATDLYQYEEHEKSTGHVEKLNKVDKQLNPFKFCFICRQPVTNGTFSEHNESVQHLDAIKMILNI